MSSTLKLHKHTLFSEQIIQYAKKFILEGKPSLNVIEKTKQI